MSKKFQVSEIFSSVQAEGFTMGVPSIFIRLGGCNLGCIHCDSNYAWAFSREKADKHKDKMLFNEIDELTVMDSKEIIAKVNGLNFGGGIENVVITGGEPLVWNSIIGELITRLDDHGYRIEVETNGTIIPKESCWCDLVSQWNVSPKLENSGVDRELRERPEVYRWFVEQEGKAFKGWMDDDIDVIFKFVVSVPDDLQEVLYLQKEYDIPSGMIWLMPEGRNEGEIKYKSNGIIEMCKRYGFRYCPRLQVMLWGNKRGV